MYNFRFNSEDLRSVKGCPVHKNSYTGHLTLYVDKSIYMIPYRFATRDALKYGNAVAMNTTIRSGTETSNDVANHYFDRI